MMGIIVVVVVVVVVITSGLCASVVLVLFGFSVMSGLAWKSKFVLKDGKIYFLNSGVYSG